MVSPEGLEPSTYSLGGGAVLKKLIKINALQVIKIVGDDLVKKSGKSMVSPAGLEPAIYRLGGDCVIHYATETHGADCNR